MIPRTTPKGFLFPPVVADDKTIGRIGHIHGANIVTNPEINANISNVSMNVIPVSAEAGMRIHPLVYCGIRTVSITNVTPLLEITSDVSIVASLTISLPFIL